MAKGFFVLAIPKSGLFAREGKLFTGSGRPVETGVMKIHATDEAAQSYVGDLVAAYKGTIKEAATVHLIVLEVEHCLVPQTRKGGSK